MARIHRESLIFYIRNHIIDWPLCLLRIRRYDLNTLLKGIAGTRQDISLSLKDDQLGETSRIAVAEAIAQALLCDSTEGVAISITSKEGAGPGEDSARWGAMFESLKKA